MASQMTKCVAFEGLKLIASGELESVALQVKRRLDRGDTEPFLIFDDTTSEQIEIDFRGTPKDVARRLAESTAPAVPTAGPETPSPRGPGRPKLGVVAREVTLLPRHWEWLNVQPGGASVALRKLVEEARRTNQGKDRKRRAQESAYRFLSALAGNLPDFEEATRALFADDPRKFKEMTENWPEGVKTHAQKLAGAAFDQR